MDSEDSDLKWDKAMGWAGKDEYKLIRDASWEIDLGLVTLEDLNKNHRKEIEEQIIKMRLKDG